MPVRRKLLIKNDTGPHGPKTGVGYIQKVARWAQKQSTGLDIEPSPNQPATIPKQL